MGDRGERRGVDPDQVRCLDVARIMRERQGRWGESGHRLLAALAYRELHPSVDGHFLKAMFKGSSARIYAPTQWKGFAVTVADVLACASAVAAIAKGSTPAFSAPVSSRVSEGRGPSPPKRPIAPAKRSRPAKGEAAGRDRDGDREAGCARRERPAPGARLPPAAPVAHPADTAGERWVFDRVVALRRRGVGWGAIAAQVGRNELSLRKRFDPTFVGA